ncbi:hypothetical protein [Nostoc sp.]|uniref:hypothetical protein n=1 Tax=Nostoc sp. TaxID=1180 RepID=UPI003FA60B08
MVILVIDDAMSMFLKVNTEIIGLLELAVSKAGDAFSTRRYANGGLRLRLINFSLKELLFDFVDSWHRTTNLIEVFH